MKTVLFALICLSFFSCNINNPNKWEWRGEWQKLEKTSIDLNGLNEKLNLIKTRNPYFENAEKVIIYQFKDLNLDKKYYFTDILFFVGEHAYITSINSEIEVKEIKKIGNKKKRFFQEKTSSLKKKFYERGFLASDSVVGIFAVFHKNDLFYYFKSSGFGCDVRNKKDYMVDCKSIINKLYKSARSAQR